jgi:hypothetical protein
MFNLMEQMEIADAQTRNKRKNRMLLYKESEIDEVFRRNTDKIKAMQELKPLYPWTDKFRQGEFVIRKYKGGVKNQISNTKRQIESIKDFRDEISNAQTDLNAEPRFAGRGHVANDLIEAEKNADSTQSLREQELNLIQNLTPQKLAMAINNLRPKGKLYVSNNDVLRMTALERAAYLTETLGASETMILTAANS